MTTALPLWELIVRLALAGVLGGLIGLERESHQRPAGFRTHILVCLGSTLVMLVSVYGFEGLAQGDAVRIDPGRLAAQVVSGIGFLGAGTILREGANVRGLTTAASLWVVAGIGLAIGVGQYIGAIVTVVLSVMTLMILSRVEVRFLNSKQAVLHVKIHDRPGMLGEITTLMGHHRINIAGVNIESVESGEHAEEHAAKLVLRIDIPPKVSQDTLLREIAELDGIRSIEWE